MTRKQQRAVANPRNVASGQLADVFDSQLLLVAQEMLQNMDAAVAKQARAAGVLAPPSIADAIYIDLPNPTNSSKDEVADRVINGAKSVISGFIHGAEDVADGIVNGIHEVFGPHDDVDGAKQPVPPSEPPSEPVPTADRVVNEHVHRTMQTVFDRADSAKLLQVYEDLLRIHKSFFNEFGTGNSPVERILDEIEAVVNTYHQELEHTDDPAALISQLVPALRAMVNPKIEDVIATSDNNIGQIVSDNIDRDDLEIFKQDIASTIDKDNSGIEGAMAMAVARTVDFAAQEGAAFLHDYARAMNTLVLTINHLNEHFDSAVERLEQVTDAIRNGTVLKNDPLYDFLTHLDDYSEFTDALADSVNAMFGFISKGAVVDTAAADANNGLRFAIRSIQSIADSVISAAFGGVDYINRTYVAPDDRKKPTVFKIIGKIVEAISSKNPQLGNVLSEFLTFIETIKMADPDFTSDIKNPATIKDALHALIDALKAVASA
ncbi:predicted protein [Lichtheimia corymbifera JMRC:FSU:9682]|uniref:Uncharacterized protein n=1 Tax=Lichtheimia corymbifera JMRC:FSU:9682 TaxID=1263082 RepID=A0A068SEA0_9FUNG|nr:predicted protein [Lichtheimia corymbifera JMRC:FSU:9682]